MGWARLLRVTGPLLLTLLPVLLALTTWAPWAMVWGAVEPLAVLGYGALGLAVGAFLDELGEAAPYLHRSAALGGVAYLATRLAALAVPGVPWPAGARAVLAPTLVLGVGYLAAVATGRALAAVWRVGTAEEGGQKGRRPA